MIFSNEDSMIFGGGAFAWKQPPNGLGPLVRELINYIMEEMERKGVRLEIIFYVVYLDFLHSLDF